MPETKKKVTPRGPPKRYETIPIWDNDNKEVKIKFRISLPHIKKRELLHEVANLEKLGTKGFKVDWNKWNQVIVDACIAEPAEYADGGYDKIKHLHESEYYKIMGLVRKYHNMENFLEALTLELPFQKSISTREKTSD